jgi:hypothetical protein
MGWKVGAPDGLPISTSDPWGGGEAAKAVFA